MSVTIKLRGDTEANWQAANPVLADREVALSTDKLNFKVGDGSTAWASLGYWLPVNLSLLTISTLGFLGINDNSPSNPLSIKGDVGGKSRIEFITTTVARKFLFGITGSADNELLVYDSQNSKSIATIGTLRTRFYQNGTTFVTLENNEMKVSNGQLQLSEITPPAAPAANNVRLYAKDNGSGKTQLCVKFSDGTETVLATQP